MKPGVPRATVTAVVTALLVAASLACGGVADGEPQVLVPAPPPAPTLSADDLAGETFVEGAKVKAIRGKTTKPQNATFIAQYGKIAQLRFADANTGWVLVKSIEPPGAIQLPPAGDSCERAVGDKVSAPWSTSYSKFTGSVGELHGKMAFIRYDDGEKDWAACDALDDPPEASGGGGGGGGGAQSDAVAKCKRGCNARCKGAQNTSKCVGQCRRACDG